MFQTAPNTPRHGSHSQAIDNIINDLNRTTYVDLPLRDKAIWSPSFLGRRSDGDRCIELIKRQYFRCAADLELTIDDFKFEADAIPVEARLDLLIRRLSEAVQDGNTKPLPEREEKAPPISKFGDRLFEEPVARKPSPELFTETQWEDCDFATPPQSPTAQYSTPSTNLRGRQTGKRSSDSGSPPSIKYNRVNNGSRRTSRSLPGPIFDRNSTPYVNMPAPLPMDSAATSFQSSFASSLVKDTSANTSFTTVDLDETERGQLSELASSLDWFGSLPSSVPLLQAMEMYEQEQEALDHVTKSEQIELLNRSKVNDCDLQAAVPKAYVKLPQPLEQAGPEHHLLRALPSAGLFLNENVMPGLHGRHAFRVRYECVRTSISLGLPIGEILTARTPSDFDGLRSHLGILTTAQGKTVQPITAKSWEAAKDKYAKVNLSGHLELCASKDAIFNLVLQPLQLGDSCRFQRHYGGDRFLYLKVPKVERANLKRYMASPLQFRQRFLQWLTTEKDFLGRVWNVIHIERTRSKKVIGQKKKFDENKFEYRVVLFATRGCDISPSKFSSTTHAYPSSAPAATVEELLEWFMPIQKNAQQLFCKAYARISLGFSTTWPALIFKPSQVRRIGDVLADGTPECNLFDDTDLPPALTPASEPAVMNDGCSRISLGACRLIWEALGRTGPMPAAFQGRINGAKGMWVRSAPVDSRFEDDNDIWIEINNSQEKFRPHDEDTDESCDADRWTFEVSSATHKVSPNVMHMSFLPILADRGVNVKILESVAIQELDIQRQELLVAIADPVALRAWINKSNSSLEEGYRNTGIGRQADLPLPLLEKVILLLESGFDPSKVPFLGNIVLRLIKKYYTKVLQNLSVRMDKSVSILGIADPTGSLEPGEIYLAFSEPLLDELTGEVCSMLRDREALVTRHPVLRRSDVQKVRCVYREELSHLLDVVVFPSRGQVPLASKLQGGDYDGDTFWVCWDARLVRDFRNAPVSAQLPSPQELGIMVDRRKLGEVLPVSKFFEESFKFRLQPDMLGIVTNAHERLQYATGQVHSLAIEAFADLHDTIIDSAKNGYIFGEDDYRGFENKNTGGKKLRAPAYKEALEKGDLNPNLDTKRPIANAVLRRVWKSDNVIDNMCFAVIKPHIDRTFALLDQAMCKTQNTDDEEITQILLQETDLIAGDQDLVQELSSLRSSCEKIAYQWRSRLISARDVFGKSDRFAEPDFYNDVLEACHKMFTDIEPVNATHPIVRRWTGGRIGQGPSRWELLKAATLFEVAHAQGHGTFVFHVAGQAICYLKAAQDPQTRQVVLPLWSQMKPKRYRGPNVIVQRDDEAEEDLFDSDDDDWQTAIA